MHSLFLCGWRVCSEMLLPELLPWTYDNRAADITIRIGPVPELADPRVLSPSLSLNCAGAFRLEIPNVATYYVAAGHSVIIEPKIAADSVDIRNFLYGTVLGILCHQRRVFPLHGSCLQLGDGAVVFSGGSGAGKSTLAAALARRGHILMCDDVSVITGTAEEGFMVESAFPRAKLMPDAIDALDVRGVPSLPAPHGTPKGHFTFARFGDTHPVRAPLRAIYFLKAADGSCSASITDLRAKDRLTYLRSQIYRPRIGNILQRGASLFKTAAEIAGRVPIRLLSRRICLDTIGDTAKLLEQLHPPFRP
jgi:hypothetical protein